MRVKYYPHIKYSLHSAQTILIEFELRNDGVPLGEERIILFLIITIANMYRFTCSEKNCKMKAIQDLEKRYVLCKVTNLICLKRVILELIKLLRDQN